jgi:hypothetical protein
MGRVFWTPKMGKFRCPLIIYMTLASANAAGQKPDVFFVFGKRDE